MALCMCGSGDLVRALKDARGIFCTYVCDACEERKRAQFNPGIFIDANYEADEPIEDE